MTILSLPAIARLVERHVRDHGPITATDLLAWLKSIDVDQDRAAAGLRLAVIGGRLEPAPGDTLHAAAMPPAVRPDHEAKEHQT